MSQTQANELTIGAKQALEGDKRRRGLIGGLHFVLSRPRQHGTVRQRNESYCNLARSVFSGTGRHKVREPTNGAHR